MNYWLYGFPKAATAWEKLYSGYLERVRFKQGIYGGKGYIARSAAAAWVPQGRRGVGEVSDGVIAERFQNRETELLVFLVKLDLIEIR